MPVLVDPMTPLLWRACLAGDAALIEEELKAGRSDPHKLDRNGESCLHMAARGGSAKGLERLLDEGLHLDHANHNDQTALHVAVNLDNLNLVRTMAQYGVDLDLTSRYSGMTALHLACRLGHEDIVQCLLESGANCATRDQIKKWPDHYTANRTILNVFDKHFEVCTHGRRKGSDLYRAINTSSLHSSSLLDSTLTLLQHNTTLGATGITAGNPSVTRDAAGVPVIDDDTEMQKLAAQGHLQRDREGPQYGNIRHGDVEIFDEMAKYNPDRDDMEAGTIKKNEKKWKINHKMDFSDQHKKRMQQNVFDRLLLASKKKENA
ncbi:hypothetical protein RRG08_006265 [Elysia crispata]|uniref:Uncharacterized protein n=1 Tax=Elysia crispata TaxID=231223 RepID=A0AAE0YPR5_9GAST|nr:hypothetical protein RRG08_006265 [Elysia crispata]